MKTMLKLLLAVGCVVGWHELASAATFLDKTSLPQLGYRTLEPGQVTWNEEDGSAVLYVGSPTETKNLRVVDPASLRGYRYKHITDELTYNCGTNMTDLGNGKFKWVRSTPGERKFIYELVDRDLKMPANNGSAWTSNEDGVPAVSGGGFPYNADNRVCTINAATGEYEEIWPTTGEILSPTNMAGIVYYKKIGCYEANIQIISKDSSIQELDYVFTQAQGGIGDFYPIVTTREIVYDGRTATLTVRVLSTSSNDKWFQVDSFDAKCIGVGDIDGYVNDVTDEFTIKIKDQHGTYDLNNLRHELYHKYDGNRGFDWSKYSAYQNAKMRDYSLTWAYTWTNLNDSTEIKTSQFGIGLMGEKKDQMAISASGQTMMRFVTSDSAANPYSGAQIQITEWKQNSDTGCWEMTFDCSIGIPARYLYIKYRRRLENYDNIWEEITSVLTDTSGGAGTSYKAVIPQVYGMPATGFFRVGCSASQYYNRVKVKATLSVLGSDGYMYKLTFPEGGGAVTAVLDDNED